MDYAYDENNEPESAAWAHNVLGVFNEQGAVCEAYARSFQLLLNYSGVENVFVTGTANGEGHAWNLVRLDDGNWYWYDLTWDDEGELGYTVTKNMGIYRTYFCVAGSTLSKHTLHTSAGANVEFLYDLPAPATTAYTDDTGRLLKSTFTTDDCQFTIVGYNAVELNYYTSATGEANIPETITYNGVTYTIVSISNNENSII